MKSIAKPKKPGSKRRRIVARIKPAAPAQLTDEEFRRQLHLDLADEIASARKAARQRFGHLLRSRTPAEIKARSARVRAMFARWEREDRENPPPPGDWERFKATLEANRMRSAPIFADA